MLEVITFCSKCTIEVCFLLYLMMSMKKLLFILATIFGCTALVSGQNFMDGNFFSEKEVSYEDLLKGFADSDSSLERMKIKMEAAEISYDQSSIKNGISVNLSSGNGKITFNDDGTEVKMEPSATVKVPDLNNLSVSASMPAEVKDGSMEVTGTTVKVSADILTGNRTNLKITNMETSRSLQNARNNLNNQERGVEGDFLSTIQSIYEKASSLMQYRETYLDKLVRLDEVAVNGYSKSSSKYKIAQIEKDSAYSECEKAYREYVNLLSDFSAKCGYEVDYLITGIPDVELVDFASFDMNSFAQINQALYSQEIGELKRAANKKWTLTGNVGYTQSNKTDESSVTTGLNTTWGGLGLGLDVFVPVSGSASPSLGFNVSVNPFAWKSQKLTEESGQLDAKLEQLDVDDAYDKYNSSKRSYQNQAETLKWESELLKEQTTYYKDVCDEMNKAYKSGLINKTDYIKAENQYMKVYLNMLKNKIKKIQYNLEVQKLFISAQ